MELLIPISLQGPLVKEYRNKIKNALISNDLEEIDNLLGRAEKFKLSANEAEDEEVEENGHNYVRRQQKKKQDEDVRRLQKRKEFLEMKQSMHFQRQFCLYGLR